MDKTPPTMIKLLWTWIAIALAINILYTGYIISYDFDTSTTQDGLYSIFAQQETSANTSTSSLINLTSDYDSSDFTTSESESSTILDKVDTILAPAKWMWFIVRFATYGGIYNSLIIWDMVENNFLAFAISIFLAGGNIIFIILAVRWIFNKGRDT